jgi:RimJ/RimL family protein N-acetyltransferase
VSLRVLPTARLRLEPVTSAHLPLLVELNADPEVMRYLMGRAATPEETAAEWEMRLDTHTDAERGLGYWAGYEDGVFVGWWSASSYAADPTLSGLGYRLRRSAWGRGLASEGARATLAQAFSVPEVDHVVATTMAVNHRSRAVMERIGLRYERTWVEELDDPLPGSELGEVQYGVRRADWLASRPAHEEC